MLLLRDAQRSDLPSLARLAKALNTVNLPYDARALSRIIDRSRRSFAGRIRDPSSATTSSSRRTRAAGASSAPPW